MQESFKPTQRPKKTFSDLFSDTLLDNALEGLFAIFHILLILSCVVLMGFLFSCFLLVKVLIIAISSLAFVAFMISVMHCLATYYKNKDKKETHDDLILDACFIFLALLIIIIGVVVGLNVFTHSFLIPLLLVGSGLPLTLFIFIELQEGQKKLEFATILVLFLLTLGLCVVLSLSLISLISLSPMVLYALSFALLSLAISIVIVQWALALRFFSVIPKIKIRTNTYFFVISRGIGVLNNLSLAGLVLGVAWASWLSAHFFAFFVLVKVSLIVTNLLCILRNLFMRTSDHQLSDNWLENTTHLFIIGASVFSLMGTITLPFILYFALALTGIGVIYKFFKLIFLAAGSSTIWINWFNEVKGMPEQAQIPQFFFKKATDYIKGFYKNFVLFGQGIASASFLLSLFLLILAQFYAAQILLSVSAALVIISSISLITFYHIGESKLKKFPLSSFPHSVSSESLSEEVSLIAKNVLDEQLSGEDKCMLGRFVSHVFSSYF